MPIDVLNALIDTSAAPAVPAVPAEPSYPIPPAPCPACGSAVYWDAPQGGRFCIGCQPPLFPNMVKKKWIVLVFGGGDQPQYAWGPTRDDESGRLPGASGSEKKLAKSAKFTFEHQGRMWYAEQHPIEGWWRYTRADYNVDLWDSDKKLAGEEIDAEREALEELQRWNEQVYATVKGKVKRLVVKVPAGGKRPRTGMSRRRKESSGGQTSIEV